LTNGISFVWVYGTILQSLFQKPKFTLLRTFFACIQRGAVTKQTQNFLNLSEMGLREVNSAVIRQVDGVRLLGALKIDIDKRLLHICAKNFPIAVTYLLITAITLGTQT
jgi:hypothetical protein